MAFLLAAIRRDSASLKRFPFHCHVQISSCEMSLVCRLKCPYNHFSLHFYFLVFVVLFIFELFLIALNSLSLLFSCSV